MKRRDFISKAALGGLAAATIPPDMIVAESGYSDIRGFNYQPSWGSNDTAIWNHFREDLFAQELAPVQTIYTGTA